MTERNQTLEEKAQADATIAANSWQETAFANVSAFEQNPDYDGAVPPLVAAEIARERLREAGLYERVGEIITPEVNYR